jgi:acyl carrier protein
VTRDEVVEVVDRVLVEVLQLDPGEVAGATRESAAEWSSLAQVEIFFSLEEELGVKLSDDAMAFVESRDDLVEYALGELGF